MKSIALVLSGVLQSWGTTTIGHSRATSNYPTKSAVVGMLANAMGRLRSDDISDISSLLLGVRIDSPGVIQRDYHSVSILTRPTKDERVTRITERFYLSDAVFVVVLSHENEELIDSIVTSINKPSRPIYLGRKSCPPMRKLFLGVFDTDLITVLNEIPWQALKYTQESYLDSIVTLDVFRDAVDDIEGFESDVVNDHPLSFDPNSRRYASRGVYRSLVSIPVKNTDTKKMIPKYMTLAIKASDGAECI